jgi:phosphohistidine phosphatase
MDVMLVFLIRHAHALDAAEDSGRPLSKRGRSQVRTLALFLKQTAVFQPDELWHSPLARARETAALLGRRLGLRAKLVTVAELESGDGVTVIAERLRKRRRPLALVGHEPHLSALASLLVAGAAEPSLFVLRKCAVVALERTGARWAVRWQVSPELLAPAPRVAAGSLK